MNDGYIQTTGVSICCSCFSDLTIVLYKMKLRVKTDTTNPMAPNTTPTLNHILRKRVLQLPSLRKNRLRPVVYHRTCPMDTDRPVLLRKVMYDVDHSTLDCNTKHLNM